jgi:hypothetical protein
MKFIIFMTIFFVVSTFAGNAFADRAQCEKELSSVMKKAESGVRTMPKQDASVHKYCVMWLYERANYEYNKKQNGGKEPCPSDSSDWKAMLVKLMDAYGSARSVCGNKSICKKGCGKALKIIRSGGSAAQALRSIPND